MKSWSSTPRSRFRLRSTPPTKRRWPRSTWPIALVASGIARRVRVANIAEVTADHIAGVGAARAGAAGVRFVVERSSLSRTLTVGPRVR